MTLDLAVRLTEIILAISYAQQSIEYLRGFPQEKILGVVRLVLSVLLLFAFFPVWIEAILLVIAALLLVRFQGPYNGGSDAMSILVLLCVFLVHVAPTAFWQEVAFGYLAFQLLFSYFQSGYVKVINADWRSGQALRDVFAFTAYPVSEHARRWASSPRLMRAMSGLVILFELMFPLSLCNYYLLILALIFAACFHLANACFFGLNRFFWIWPAAYPAILWFQSRVMGG
jgi:hypothetical protein